MADLDGSRLEPPDSIIDAWKTAVVTVDVDGARMDPREVAAQRHCLVHVVTAWNPGAIELDPESNDRATAALEERLRQMGARSLPARGRDEKSVWEEPGFAVVGRSREEMRALAASFGQVAIFESDAEQTLIVWCASDRVITKDR
jgi:hypothetical protein